MLKYRLELLILFLFPFFTEAAYVGNFASAAINRDGFVFSENCFFHIKTSYLFDDVYRGAYEEGSGYRIKQKSQLGILAFNFFHYVDVYGIAGASTMDIHEPDDELCHNDWDFSWGAGLSCVIFHWNHFFVGADGKYFRSRVKPSYVRFEGKACTLTTPVSVTLEDMQGALGIAYQSEYFTPYIGVSYIYSTVTPLPHSGYIDIPDYPANPAQLTLKALFIKERWGLVLGTSIVGKGPVSLNLEARFINQDAFHVSGTLCF